MTVGGILRESWGLYTRFFKRFFVIAMIVYLIVNLLNALVATLFGHGLGVSLLLALHCDRRLLVGTFWLQGALVFAVDDVRDGRIDSTLGELFERVRPHLGTLILAGILAGLGIAVGLVLLIVPGLILLTWWCLIVPVIVLEGKHVGDSFSRSRELVRGHALDGFRCCRGDHGILRRSPRGSSSRSSRSSARFSATGSAARSRARSSARSSPSR